MTNTKIKIFIGIAVIVLAGGAFWFFLYSDVEIFKLLNFKSLNIETFKHLNSEDQRNIGASTPLDQDLTGQVSEKSAGMSETYTNSKYGFSFSHPKELNVSEFAEEGADSTSSPQADVVLAGGVFQLLISPFDESEPITKARILKDIPDMAIADDKIISVGGFDGLTAGGVNALSFKSKDESGGETLEIWFVRNGYLYQISSFASFEKQILQILGTWKFQ